VKSRIFGRSTWLPLAVGLMMGPTLAYRAVIPELARSPLTLRGFPLPWNGDAPIGSGAPLDVFIIPAAVDLALCLPLGFLIWALVWRKLRSARTGLRAVVIGSLWLYVALNLFMMWARMVWGGTWKLWYDDNYGQLLLDGLRASSVL